MKALRRALLMPWAGGDTSMAYTNKVIALSPIAYWPLAEASGSTATDASGNSRTGAYTGVTLGVTGIGDGRTAASFDGSTSFNNVFTASLQSAFNGQEGTVAGWAKVSAAGVWTDAAFRETFRFFVTGGANLVFVRKSSTNNTVQFQYVAGGTTKTVNAGAFSPTAWFHWALTWSKANDQMIAYLNGAQVGATQTGLGTWAGTPASNQMCVGASITTPAEVWNGSLAHVALWTSPLNSTQIASLAVVP